MNEDSTTNAAGKLEVLYPTLYIGLGGTGLETLKVIKRQNQKTYPEGCHAFAYLSVDTRTNDGQSLEATEMLSLSQSELSGNEGSIMASIEGRFPHILKWMPDIEKWHHLLDFTALKVSVTQCRAIGRVLLHLSAEDVYAKIVHKLHSITGIQVLASEAQHGLQVDPSAGIAIYIVGSLCGGTGSGQFLDVAYLCRKASAQFQGAKISGILGMPNLFVKVHGSKLNNEANAYAALKELNHFMDPKTKYEMDFGFDTYSTNDKPFDAVYLINSPNSSGVSFATRDEAANMMGQALFSLSASKAKTTWDEYYTNIATQTNTEAKNGKGTPFKTWVSSLGVGGLIFPCEKVTQVLTHRKLRDFCADVCHKNGTPDEYDEKSRIIAENLKLTPDDVLSHLGKNCTKQINSWIKSAQSTLSGCAEDALASNLEGTLADLEARRIPALNQQIKKASEVPEFDLSTTEAFEKLVAEIVDNKKEGLGFAIGTLEDLKNDLTVFRQDLQQRLGALIGVQEESLGVDKTFRKMHLTAFFDNSERIQALSEQSFFKDLFDFDKKDQLDQFCKKALHSLKTFFQAKIDHSLLCTSITIFDGFVKSVEENLKRLQTLETWVGAIKQAADINFKQQKSVLLVGQEGVDYFVANKERLDSLYAGISSKTIEVDVIKKDPVSTWVTNCPTQKELATLLSDDFSEKISKELRTNTIYGELKNTGAYESLVNGSLRNISAPFLKFNLATMVTGGNSHSEKMLILGVPDSTKADKQLTELVETSHLATLSDPHYISLLQVALGYPPFAISDIKSLHYSMIQVRSRGVDPCYTYDDEFIQGFADLLPDSGCSVSLYQRVVHAFDLGVMTGFLCKNPKGRVYYLCSMANDLDSGDPVADEKGGGRKNTKIWFLRTENLEFLEALEKSISDHFSSIDKPSMERVKDAWKIHCKAAVMKSRNKLDWQHPEDPSILDYPSLNSPEPALLTKALAAKGL